MLHVSRALELHIGLQVELLVELSVELLVEPLEELCRALVELRAEIRAGLHHGLPLGSVGHGGSFTAVVRRVVFHYGIRLYYPSFDLSRDPYKGSISPVY